MTPSYEEFILAVKISGSVVCGSVDPIALRSGSGLWRCTRSRFTIPWNVQRVQFQNWEQCDPPKSTSRNFNWQNNSSFNCCAHLINRTYWQLLSNQFSIRYISAQSVFLRKRLPLRTSKEEIFSSKWSIVEMEAPFFILSRKIHHQFAWCYVVNGTQFIAVCILTFLLMLQLNW